MSVQGSDTPCVEIDMEDARGDAGRFSRQRPSLLLPAVEPAIEDIDLENAHGPEHPPHARRRKESRTIIDDDRVVCGNPHRSGIAREQFRPRQGVRQVRVGIDDVVLVEEDCARNMSRLILGGGVAPLRRQVPGGVDDRQAGRRQPTLQPVGIDHERACFGHAESSGGLVSSGIFAGPPKGPAKANHIESRSAIRQKPKLSHVARYATCSPDDRVVSASRAEAPARAGRSQQAAA